MSKSVLLNIIDTLLRPDTCKQICCLLTLVFHTHVCHKCETEPRGLLRGGRAGGCVTLKNTLYEWDLRSPLTVLAPAGVHAGREARALTHTMRPGAAAGPCGRQRPLSARAGGPSAQPRSRGQEEGASAASPGAAARCRAGSAPAAPGTLRPGGGFRPAQQARTGGGSVGGGPGRGSAVAVVRAAGSGLGPMASSSSIDIEDATQHLRDILKLDRPGGEGPGPREAAGGGAWPGRGRFTGPRPGPGLLDAPQLVPL